MQFNKSLARAGFIVQAFPLDTPMFASVDEANEYCQRLAAQAATPMVFFVFPFSDLVEVEQTPRIDAGVGEALESMEVGDGMKLAPVSRDGKSVILPMPAEKVLTLKEEG